MCFFSAVRDTFLCSQAECFCYTSLKSNLLDKVRWLLHCSKLEQGWRSVESALLPPEFDYLTQRHMSVEFVGGSLPCSDRFFSGNSGFPLSSEKKNFQIPIRSGLLLALCNEPLARVIVQALPVFDIIFSFTFLF